jgi:hypothetical protein
MLPPANCPADTLARFRHAGRCSEVETNAG